jgi:hypothetical protein
MKKQGRIPMKLETFITFIVLVDEYLHTILPGSTDARGIELGMTTAELAALKDWVKKFISGDPTHPGIWDLHKSKQTKTHTTRQNMVDSQKLFAAFFRPMLVRMSGSALITNGDRDTLNIAHPVTTHIKPTTPIKEQCVIGIKMLGQCKVKFVCKAIEDEARASKPEGANAVEIALLSRPVITTEPTKDNILAGKVRPKSMLGPSEASSFRIFTKAIFIIQFPDTDLGNDLQLFGRWINTNYPDLAGPWSGLYSRIIS